MRARHLSFVVAFALLIAACRGGSEGLLTVKGQLAPGTAQAPLSGTPQVGRSAQELRTSDGPVARVLVFRGFGRADVVAVDAQGRFAVDVSRAQPVGLVFLDATDAVVGVLSLGEGLAALPLSVGAEGLATIDLSTISLDGGVATPSANPVAAGGALALDDTQRAVFTLQSSLFSSIVLNLDLNRDDVIDVRSSKPYWLMFQAIYAGQLGQGAPVADGGLPSFTEFRLLFSDGQPVGLEPPPVLRLPNGAEVRQVQAEQRWTGDSDGSQLPCYSFASGSAAPGFTAGAWAITYGAGPEHLAFDVRTPLASQHHVVATDVWMESGNDTLTLHWRWGLAGGAGTVVDAPRLLRFVLPGLNFTDGSTSHVNETPAPSQTSYTFRLEGKQPRAWSITARDSFGNETWTQGRVP